MTDALHAERALREHACPEHYRPPGTPCCGWGWGYEPPESGGWMVAVWVCPARIALVQQRGPEPAEGNERAAGVAHSVVGDLYGSAWSNTERVDASSFPSPGFEPGSRLRVYTEGDDR